MENVSIKKGYQPLRDLLVANKDAKVGDILSQAIGLMSAGGRAVDKAIKGVDGKVLAYVSTYSGLFQPVVGDNAGETRQVANSTTGWNNMTQEEQALYNKARLEYNKSKEANDLANAHNAQLLVKVSKGEVKASEVGGLMKEVVDLEAIMRPDLSAVSTGFKTREECVAYLKKAGFKTL